ncbi:hypothetical protein AMTR_s02405p00007800 [Amborella trichopoda]|uniref:beta-N-acetylhexosaminidase n=1 Tax=Amborella trichopoda TaxID=13333 RepID=U5CV34_AMBTC|nr:hypothetical protein AMTR_s02405p00007800 [Amborella trichopoda]
MNLHYISNALCSLSSLLLLLHLFYSHLHCSAPQVLVWPKARNLTWAPPYSSILLSPTFTISYSGSNPYLQNAVSRYLRLIFPEKYTPVRPIPSNLTASAQPLQTLTLSVNDETPRRSNMGSTNLTRSRFPMALQYCGRPRCGEQCVDWRRSRSWFGAIRPDYRNYYGMREILRTIRAMSENKMSVFHWHITDSHSFPIVLPELAEKGSYGAGMQYSAEEVRGIVEFGMSRGVRVVPETDSPGNSSTPFFALCFSFNGEGLV